VDHKPAVAAAHPSAMPVRRVRPGKPTVESHRSQRTTPAPVRLAGRERHLAPRARQRGWWARPEVPRCHFEAQARAPDRCRHPAPQRRRCAPAEEAKAQARSAPARCAHSITRGCRARRRLMAVEITPPESSITQRSLDRRRISNVDSVLWRVVHRDRVSVKFNGIDHEREAAPRALVSTPHEHRR
jgi:hypothetical protein